MNNESLVVGGLDVSRETMNDLDSLAALITKWTKSINLIAAASVSNLWDRHISDSAQILAHAPENWQTWTDIGSGGGLPALVIAVIDPLKRPITLVESDQRKCLFLNTARRELDLNIRVINGRIEDQDLPPADILTARALSPLVQLLSYSEGLLKSEGTALFPKGEKYETEVTDARQDWNFDIKFHTSKTHPQAKILEISRISRREH